MRTHRVLVEQLLVTRKRLVMPRTCVMVPVFCSLEMAASARKRALDKRFLTAVGTFAFLACMVALYLGSWPFLCVWAGGKLATACAPKNTCATHKRARARRANESGAGFVASAKARGSKQAGLC